MNVLEYPKISQCPLFLESYDKFPQWLPMSFDELLVGVSHEARDLATKLLKIEPSLRISVKEALHHRFFKDLNREALEKLMIY